MTPIETTVETYISAARERDPVARSKLIAACFAEDGRLVTRSGVIRGRAGVEAMLTRALSDPAFRFRMASKVDAVGTTFRYLSIVTLGDGSEQEFFDAGEVDADGMIVTLFAFSGPLESYTAT